MVGTIHNASSDSPQSFRYAIKWPRLGHVFFNRTFFRERPWQHEPGFEHSAGFLHKPIERGGHPGHRAVDRTALNVRDAVARVGLIPAAVKVSVAKPSWTFRTPERSSGASSPRFSLTVAGLSHPCLS
jgi:hypothetical protein